MTYYLIILLMLVLIPGNHSAYSLSDQTESIIQLIKDNAENPDISTVIRNISQNYDVQDTNTIRQDIQVYIDQKSESKDIDLYEIKYLCIAYSQCYYKINKEEFIEWIEILQSELSQFFAERTGTGIVEVDKEKELLLKFSVLYNTLSEFLNISYNNGNFEDAIKLIEINLQSEFSYTRSTSIRYLKKFICSSDTKYQLNENVYDIIKRLPELERKNMEVKYLDIVYSKYESESIIKICNQIMNCIKER